MLTGVCVCVCVRVCVCVCVCVRARAGVQVSCPYLYAGAGVCVLNVSMCTSRHTQLKAHGQDHVGSAHSTHQSPHLNESRKASAVCKHSPGRAFTLRDALVTRASAVQACE